MLIQPRRPDFLSFDWEKSRFRSGGQGDYFWPVLLALLASAFVTCAALLVIWLEVQFKGPF